MSNIVTCQCGVKLQLPDAEGARVFRCPKCEAEIYSPEKFAPLSSDLGDLDGAPTCPICQTQVEPGAPIQQCPNCQQVHHAECWQEIGGCSTYGCEKAPALAKEEAPASRPLTAWGDTKKCPVCGETIKSIALRCRYCRTDFDTADPLTAADVRRKVRRSENVKGLQNTVVVLFAITLLVGCVAPVMLIISLCVVLPKRRLLAKAGPFYLVLGYSTIGLSVLYSILMLVFAFAGLGQS